MYRFGVVLTFKSMYLTFYSVRKAPGAIRNTITIQGLERSCGQCLPYFLWCNDHPLLQPLRAPSPCAGRLAWQLDKVNRREEEGESVSHHCVTKCNLSKMPIIGDKNKTGGISLALAHLDTGEPCLVFC